MKWIAVRRITGSLPPASKCCSDEWVGVPNNVIQYRSLDGDTGETRGGHWCGVTYWKQQDQVSGFEYPPTLNHPELHPSGFSTRCVILPPGLF
jgi:hypothetical protein